MSTQQSYIGAALGDPATLSVWTGVVVVIFGIVYHAFGSETMGLMLAICGTIAMMDGVARRVASEVVEKERIAGEEE